MSQREIGSSRGSAGPQQGQRSGLRNGRGQRNWQLLADLEDRRELSEAWLKLSITMVSGVTQAVVLLREEQGEGFLPAAMWPEGATKLDSLGLAAQKALQAGQAVYLGAEDGGVEGRARIAHPLITHGKAWGVVVLELEARPEDHLRSIARGLQASCGWLQKLDPSLKVSTADDGDEGARMVLESVAVLAEKDSFKAAALGLATRLEKELECERVSVGFSTKLRVIVHAVSTSPQFVQKTNLVRSIESAMEEACDQETTVQHPVREDAPFVASIAHRAHARAYGHRSILTVPFDRNGEIVGAISLERPEGHWFTEDEVLAVEAIAALVGPSLHLAKLEERWIGSKVWGSVRGLVRGLLSERKRAVRFGVGAALASLLFLIFFQVDYRVSSDVFLEPKQQLLLSSPVQGYVQEAPARAGDLVKAGDLIYSLDETQLRLERDRLIGEELQAEKRHLQAMAVGTSAEVRILSARKEQLKAQRELADEQLSQMSVFAPHDGIIASGDLSQSIGSPLEKGQVVYSLAPLEDFRVVLEVPDSDIDECQVGQEGVIVLTSMPDREFAIKVERLTPVASAKEGLNYFRVEASLLGNSDSDLFRPGMEGVGKVAVGERGLLWTWTHSALDTIRLFIWKWTP